VIAVVIPAYDSARFIGDAIASVRAQGNVPVEIVVVDDGSTDRTSDVARSWGGDVRVLQQANQGPASARNAGVRATTAEYVAFLDADDVWPPGRLDALHASFRASPSLRMVIGRTQLVLEGRDEQGSATLLESGPPWHAPVFGSALIHREAFDVVGPLDSALEPAEDMDWFIRAREQGVPTAVIGETTLLYRLHGASLTSGADPIRRNMLVALKRSLDRRRQEPGASASRLANWLPFEESGGLR
jgi:glycosyltransferase involved in cell wall biosynthesis